MSKKNEKTQDKSIKANAVELNEGDLDQVQGGVQRVREAAARVTKFETPVLSTRKDSGEAH